MSCAGKILDDPVFLLGLPSWYGLSPILQKKGEHTFFHCHTNLPMTFQRHRGVGPPYPFPPSVLDDLGTCCRRRASRHPFPKERLHMLEYGYCVWQRLSG